MNIIETWDKAMKALPDEIAKGFSKPRFRSPKDGTDILDVQYKDQRLVYEVLKMSRVSHVVMAFIKQYADMRDNVQQQKTLIVTSIIHPRIGALLMENGINFIDTSGNIYMNEGNVTLMRLGVKSTEEKKKEGPLRMFADSGLKLLFCMLQEPKFLELSYREMADAANISPASTTIVINELLESKYLHQRNGGKVLTNKKELLDRWAVEYKQKLKPKIVLGYFKSMRNDIMQDFKSIEIQDWQGQWNGEAAANLYTNYLFPQQLSIFVKEEQRKICIKRLQLLPSDENKQVEVLKMFWNPDHPLFTNSKKIPNAVPPILAYAELMTSNDGRNLETAQRIFDGYRQFTND